MPKDKTRQDKSFSKDPVLRKGEIGPIGRQCFCLSQTEGLLAGGPRDKNRQKVAYRWGVVYILRLLVLGGRG